jgi:serine protease Do
MNSSMKTSTLVLAGIAVFAGVFGALQADHYFTSGHSSTSSPVAFREGGTLSPITYSGEAANPFDFRSAAKKITPSVVSVDQFRRMSQGFMDNAQVEREVGQGSGVILSNDGIIVTNNHVVEGASRVSVHLSDGRTLDAKVLGTDPRSDLAVIRVEAKNLTPIEMGESGSAEVGEWVLAVGNPLGFANTVSVGVVSSLKRDLPVGDQGLVNAIQTDAAINPGNSGGALCDAQGKLIGINSAIASGTGQSVGIGFSIPVDRVKVVVQDIVKYGYARYAGLGIARYPDGILADPDARQELATRTGGANVPDKGVLIRQSTGPADKAGIHALDVLLEIDHQSVGSMFDLNKVLMAKKPGDEVTVKYWSKGDVKTTQVALEELQPERRL